MLGGDIENTHRELVLVDPVFGIETDRGSVWFWNFNKFLLQWCGGGGSEVIVEKPDCRVGTVVGGWWA